MKKQKLIFSYKRYHLFVKWNHELICILPCFEYKKHKVGNTSIIKSFYLGFLNFGLNFQIFY